MIPFLQSVRMFVLCAALLLLLPAHASSFKEPFSFQHFTQREGLSSDLINTIAIRGDEVWIGTYAGGANLYREKSKKSWRAYTTKGELPATVDDGESIRWKNLLSYNHVSVILPDVDRIWFGTYFYGFGGGGISYYQAQREPPWKSFPTHQGVAKKIVSMAADGDSLWVGSEKGLSLLDKKDEKWKSFYSMQQGLSGNFVNSLIVQSDVLWAATNGGISRFHKTQRSWKTYSSKEGLTEGEFKSLAKVGRTLWAGTVEGQLFEYDATTDRWKRIEPTDPLKTAGIQSIMATKETVFICRDHGVSIYHLVENRWEALTGADGLLSDWVFCAAEDTDAIWFGTDKGVSAASGAVNDSLLPSFFR